MVKAGAKAGNGNDHPERATADQIAIVGLQGDTKALAEELAQVKEGVERAVSLSHEAVQVGRNRHEAILLRFVHLEGRVKSIEEKIAQVLEKLDKLLGLA